MKTLTHTCRLRGLLRPLTAKLHHDHVSLFTLSETMNIESSQMIYALYRVFYSREHVIKAHANIFNVGDINATDMA